MRRRWRGWWHDTVVRVSTYGSRQWGLTNERGERVGAPKHLPDGTLYIAYFYRTKHEAAEAAKNVEE